MKNRIMKKKNSKAKKKLDITSKEEHMLPIDTPFTLCDYLAMIPLTMITPQNIRRSNAT